MVPDFETVLDNMKNGNINYYQRNEVSKALPLYKIPKLIFNFLMNFFEFRKQLKKIKLTML